MGVRLNVEVFVATQAPLCDRLGARKGDVDELGVLGRESCGHEFVHAKVLTHEVKLSARAKPCLELWGGEPGHDKIEIDFVEAPVQQGITHGSADKVKLGGGVRGQKAVDTRKLATGRKC